MKNIFLMFLTLFLSINFVAQEVCKSPEETPHDLNTISVTKCTIKKNKRNKKSRQIAVTISANRRHLKKRENARKKEISNINTIGLNKLQNVSQKITDAKIEELVLEKSVTSKNKIAEINTRLSKEELQKASKFNAVDKIPLFNACKKIAKNKRLDCFNQNMIQHISKYFTYPSTAIAESIQGEVWVRFIIDKNGEVKNIKTLAPKNGDLLSKEAIRVVAKLPQFIPAQKDGNRISVKYGFPISFALQQ